MLYLLIFSVLMILELLYFRVANHFNIIDKPNDRSSHSTVTLRGGGIIFYFSVVIYFFLNGYQYPWFFLGLTLMTLVSFIDDVITLSNKVRVSIHFISVLLLAYELNIFELPWYYLLITFIVIVGVINAYNFMDGINGITACYSLAITGLLIIVNSDVNFISQELLVCVLLSLLVFSFFNFRPKAKCFAGDVGSVAIAFIILFALGALIIKTNNLIYFLFLSIYGIDSIWTILRRIYLKENIFKAHRSHLYQFLANEAKGNSLLISFLYGFLQFVIGIFVIYFSEKNWNMQILFAFSLLFTLSLIYLLSKRYVIKKFVK